MKTHSIILLLVFGGCSFTVSPPGESGERANIAAEQRPYREQVTSREVPDISQDATLREVVLYALMVNGEVEASYYEWAAAIEQVVLAGALPDPKISLQILSARESFSTLNAFLDAVRVMLDVDIGAELFVVFAHCADAMRTDGKDLGDFVVLEVLEVLFSELAEGEIVAEAAGGIAGAAFFLEHAIGDAEVLQHLGQ